MKLEHVITILKKKEEGRRNGRLKPLGRSEYLARRLLPGGSQWRFFDLGTRLQTPVTPSTAASPGRSPDDGSLPVMDGSRQFEYVEIALDAPAQFDDILSVPSVPDGETSLISGVPNNVQMSPVDPSALYAWDAHYLGIGSALDPFGSSTAFSGREVPHCMPVWFGPYDQPGIADSERILVTCNASGGTFTLSVTVGGKSATSAPIAYDASASDLKKAIEKMKPAMRSGDVAVCFGELATGVTVVFGGRLANYDMPAFAADGDGLVDGAVSVYVEDEGAGAVLPADAASAFDPSTYVESADYNPASFDLELYNASSYDIYPNAVYREVMDEISLWDRDDVNDEEYHRQTFRAMTKVLNEGWRGEDVRGTGETWNTINTSSADGVDVRAAALMEMGGASGTAHVRLNSRMAWEPFDTGDAANYKVTLEPSYSAAEVPFKIAQAKEAKFYLRPQLHCYAHRINYFRQDVCVVYSYRYEDPVTFVRYNLQTSDSDALPHSSLSVGGDMQLDLGMDPDSGPYTFTVNATIDRETGSYSISGLPGGGQSGTADFEEVGDEWRVEIVGPNYAVTLTADLWVVGQTNKTPSLSVSTEPWFYPKGNTLQVQAASWRGGHVARYPAVPANVDSLQPWDSYAPFLLTDTQTFADGSSETRTYAEGVSYPGREHISFLGSGLANRQFYTRRSNRDGKDIIFFRPFNTNLFYAEEGQGDKTYLAEAEIEWKKIHEPAETKTALDAEAETVMQDLKDQLLDEPFINQVVTSSTFSSYQQDFPRYWIMLPVDAQAGQLCAVIEQGGKRYHVWRKTGQSRGGYDWLRNSGYGRYSGSIT